MTNLRLEYVNHKEQYWEQLPNECCNCGSSNDLHIHHVVPLSVGGTNKLSNLAVICGICHLKAHGMKDHSSMTELSSKAKLKAKEEGKWFGRIPYGYVLIRGEIVIDEFEADIVRLVYKWKYMNGLRLVEIKDILDHMLIPTRKGSDWGFSTLTQMLNRYNMYLGKENLPALVREEYDEIISGFDDRFKRKKRTYQGKVLNERITCMG